MKRTSKLATGMVALALIIGASFTGSASAAVTLGSTCTGDDISGSVNFNPTLSTASSGGVITTWGTSFNGPPPGFPMGVVVVEPTGAPNEWRIANRGPLTTVNSNSFQTAVRIPVSAGQAV